MIHVGDLRQYESLPPAGKLLNLVFAMVGKDGATELRFGYHSDPPQARMWYVVAGAVYELVPPPAHLWPDLFGLLWRQTRLRRSDRPGWWHRLHRGLAFPETPTRGTLTIGFGAVPVVFDILFYRGVSRQYIELTRIGRLDVSPIATDFMTRCLTKHSGPDGMMEF